MRLILKTTFTFSLIYFSFMQGAAAMQGPGDKSYRGEPAHKFRKVDRHNVRTADGQKTSMVLEAVGSTTFPVVTSEKYSLDHAERWEPDTQNQRPRKIPSKKQKGAVEKAGVRAITPPRREKEMPRTPLSPLNGQRPVLSQSTPPSPTDVLLQGVSRLPTAGIPVREESVPSGSATPSFFEAWTADERAAFGRYVSENLQHFLESGHTEYTPFECALIRELWAQSWGSPALGRDRVFWKELDPTLAIAFPGHVETRDNTRNKAQRFLMKIFKAAGTHVGKGMPTNYGGTVLLVAYKKSIVGQAVGVAQTMPAVEAPVVRMAPLSLQPLMGAEFPGAGAENRADMHESAPQTALNDRPPVTAPPLSAGDIARLLEMIRPSALVVPPASLPVLPASALPEMAHPAVNPAEGPFPPALRRSSVDSVLGFDPLHPSRAPTPLAGWTGFSTPLHLLMGTPTSTGSGAPYPLMHTTSTSSLHLYSGHRHSF